MLAADYDRQTIKHFHIDFCLSLEASKSVAIRLDFVSVEVAVYECEVHADAAATKTEFLHECSVSLFGVVGQKFGAKG